MQAAYARAAAICDEDVAMNRAIGAHALGLFEKHWKEKGGKGRLNVLTHCNAGWLATVDWGTALSPIFQASDAGLPVHVWVDETRPRNQGAALTAWELRSHGVPHTVIVDNAGGHLMQRGEVDLCIVGTDRTTAGGDVCNKIGTYLKALAAHDNGVPFYVALPGPTIDWSLEDGRDIPIEERAADEVTHPARRCRGRQGGHLPDHAGRQRRGQPRLRRDPAAAGDRAGHRARRVRGEPRQPRRAVSGTGGRGMSAAPRRRRRPQRQPGAPEKKGPVREKTGPLVLAPEEGFEPPTGWLTATCSTAELLRIGCVRDASGAGGANRFSRYRISRSRTPFVKRCGGGNVLFWRPGPESNRRTRICSPLHHHSATGPRFRTLPGGAQGLPTVFPNAMPDGRRHIGGGRWPVKNGTGPERSPRPSPGTSPGTSPLSPGGVQPINPLRPRCCGNIAVFRYRRSPERHDGFRGSPGEHGREPDSPQQGDRSGADPRAGDAAARAVRSGRTAAAGLCRRGSAARRRPVPDGADGAGAADPDGGTGSRRDRAGRRQRHRLFRRPSCPACAKR